MCIRDSLKILQGLGARVEYLSPSAVEIDCTQVRFTEPPYDLMRKILSLIHIS